ncbi:MAG: metallophosphoesterase [Clostridia bacterium]|nr:metallophosphoesterase [Clostridia bacterium]
MKVFIYFILLILFVSPAVNAFLRSSDLEKISHAISFFYISVLTYTSVIAIVSDIVKLIINKVLKKDKSIFETKKYRYISAVISILFISSCVSYGIAHYSKITVKSYSAVINKECNIKNLKIALVADFHLGYTIGYEMMEEMAEKINNENPDIVLIAGDIFDNSAIAVDDFGKCTEALASIKSKYGTYAIFGNHDVKEKLLFGFSIEEFKSDYRDERMETMLNNAGITILDDKVTLIDNSIYIIGRKDYSKPGFGSEKRKSLDELITDVDFSKPVIILEHEPKELEIAASYGVDMHLAGHTHAGQFFPLTLAVQLVYKNAYGIKDINGMTSIVTSGVGLYGPQIRVGTNSEITMINLSFK